MVRLIYFSICLVVGFSILQNKIKPSQGIVIRLVMIQPSTVNDIVLQKKCSKQTLALRQASEKSACFLLSFFCDD